MTAPSWIVFGNLIIDDLHLPDGTVAAGLLGGSGTYAALGAALAGTGTAALVAGVGEDLSAEHRDWLRSYDIDTTALAVRGAHTPRSTVRYFADGSRTETPVWGHRHFRSMEPAVADVPPEWTHAGGAYFFATHDARQWPEILAWARHRDAALLWEISADSCTAAQFGAVAARLADVDMLSINLAEAQALCAEPDPYACADRLRAAGAAVLALHMGAEGALVADGRRLIATPAAPVARVVDATGAGNCYSGAFLASYRHSTSDRHSGDLRYAATTAAAAAAAVLGGFGVPPPLRAADP
jgi:sugar/nucleoside kinase (ribokinase family)